MAISQSIKERLISKTTKINACWVWIGAKSGYRYGAIYINSKPRRAHRVAYETFHGPIPPGMSVCHRCDVPLCINPDHLFLGSHAENMADMASKGRGTPPRGENQHASRLTKNDVKNIRALRASGVLLREIGRPYNMSESTISNIVKRRTWKHI